MPLMQQKREIGMELRMLSNRLKYNAAQLIGYDPKLFTTIQLWTITFLYNNRDIDVYQKDLEVAFGINRSTASQTIRAMEKRGLIERQSVPSDARLKKIVLTENALRLHESKVEDVRKFENQLLAGLSNNDVANLYKYIDLINDNLDSLAYTNH